MNKIRPNPYAISLLLLLLALIASVSNGAVTIGPDPVMRIFLAKLPGFTIQADWTAAETILFRVRLPHKSRLLNLVRELAHESRLAVLMVLHDLNLVRIYFDRLALLVNGRLQTTGTPQEVLTSQRLSHTFQVSIDVIPHPAYGTPLVLPDGVSRLPIHLS